MSKGLDELSAVTNVIRDNLFMTDRFGGEIGVVTSRRGRAVRMVIWFEDDRVDIRAGVNGLRLEDARGRFSTLSRTPSGKDVAAVLSQLIADLRDAAFAKED